MRKAFIDLPGAAPSDFATLCRTPTYTLIVSMMKHRIRVLPYARVAAIATGLLLFASVAPAPGMDMTPYDRWSIIQRSPLIALVHVEQVDRPAPNEQRERATPAQTEVQLRILRVLRGDVEKGATLTLSFDELIACPPQPSFRAGTREIVFLHRNADATGWEVTCPELSPVRDASDAVVDSYQQMIDGLERVIGERDAVRRKALQIGWLLACIRDEHAREDGIRDLARCAGDVYRNQYAAYERRAAGGDSQAVEWIRNAATPLRADVDLSAAEKAELRDLIDKRRRKHGPMDRDLLKLLAGHV